MNVEQQEKELNIRIGWLGGIGRFLKESWNNNPGKLVFGLGVLLFIIGGLGGVPKVGINVTTQVAFLRIMGVGFLLCILGAIMWALNTPSTGKEFRFLPWFLAFVGVSYSTVVLLVDLKKITTPQSFGSELDAVVVALALASLCGFLPAFVSARTLKARSADIRTQMSELGKREKDLMTSLKKLSEQITETVPRTMEGQLLRVDASQQKFLESLEKSRKDLVNSVEDATRSMLVGFELVFAKAYWMVDNAEEELISVNFAMNFGSAHKFNEEIKQKYPVAKKQVFEPSNDAVDFQHDVKYYFDRFHRQVVNIPLVQILTVNDAAARSNFLEPLSKRSGYDGLKHELLAQWDEVKSAKKLIKAKIGPGAGDKPEDKRLVEMDALPIQLLITKVRKENGQLRHCCLVFMVGTEVLKSGQEIGKDSAFYTELDDMVGVFRNLAMALIGSAAAAAEEAKKKRDEVG
jgi:hypothetical protein